MRARPLLVTIFGEYFGDNKKSIWLGSLIKYMEQFDIPSGTVRVTLSRLVKQGWLSSLRVGQKSYYFMTEEGFNKVIEGSRRVRKKELDQWDGKWRIVSYSIPQDLSYFRDKFRQELQWLGFGLLNNDMWISPRDIDRQVFKLTEQYNLQDFVDLFTAQYLEPSKNERLVKKTWDMESIANEYVQFIKAYTELYEYLVNLKKNNTLDDNVCFIEQTQLVHEFRKFLFIDPNLPKELLPPNWIGIQARKLFNDTYDLVKEGTDRFIQSQLEYIER